MKYMHVSHSLGINNFNPVVVGVLDSAHIRDKSSSYHARVYTAENWNVSFILLLKNVLLTPNNAMFLFHSIYGKDILKWKKHEEEGS